MRASSAAYHGIKPANNGSVIFHPLALLPQRILNYSARKYSVKLSFRASGILFHPSGEIIPNTRDISRIIYEANSIADITFRPKIKQSHKVEAKIRDFLAKGDIKIIERLYENITIHPPLEQMLKEQIPMVDLPITLSEIPGRFKYYTKHDTYRKIYREQTIRARSYQGRAARVCLTTSSLPADMAWEALFIRNPQYSNKGKGEYVFGFDLLINADHLEEKPNPFGEYWLRENVKFGRNAILRFAGLNPVAYPV